LAADQRQIQQVALAALLHDVGKFAQRAEADPEVCPALPNPRDFVVTDPRGRLSYHHAAFTWHFIEQHFPWLATPGGKDGSVARWAACHHKPTSVWEWIVAEADRLSSGFDTGHPDESTAGWANVHTARLVPILAAIGDAPNADGYEVALAPLATDERLFPGPAAIRTRQQAADEYRNLFAQFARAARTLAESDPGTFFQAFSSIYERYAWCVPASTGGHSRDTSLFEHSRAAAAIAAVLSAELLRRGTPSIERLRDRNARRYALAVGDLGGIQRFLYTISARNAARALRGRSLVLQLLTDAIGNRIARELGMPPAVILYNGGGKIWMLIPASARGPAREIAERIDLGLHQRYAARLSFTLGIADLSGRDFIDHNIAERFAAASHDLQIRRRRRFAGLLRTHYDEVFAPYGDPVIEQPCGLCGKLASLDILQDEPLQACEECRQFEDLGRTAIRATTIMRADGPDWKRRLSECRTRLDSATAFDLPDLEAGYLLYAGSWQDAIAAAGEGVCVMRLNQPPDADILETRAAVGMWLTGLSRAHDETGASLDFDGLAQSSTGVKRLAVLRMDVDSLGEIFRSGLGRNPTLSRITALSRNLSYFFGGHLSHLLSAPQWHGQAQVIYSGGDDLFVVAAWSTAPQLAREIRVRFGRLVAGNSAWGLSGGVAVVRPRHPIASAAELAGEEEHRAKQYAGRSGGRTKDAIRFLDETMSWPDFDVTAALTRELCELLSALLPRTTLHRLADIAATYRSGHAALQTKGGPPRPIAELEEAARHGRWAWTAAYSIARATTNPDLKRRLDALATALPGKTWAELDADRDLIWLLEPAVRWTDWLTRTKGD
jgi:CRISPR-associated protein Csm1